MAISEPWLMQFFQYQHEHPQLQAVGESFSNLAHLLEQLLPPNPESQVALRLLLQAKEAAIRAKVVELALNDPLH